MSTTFKIKLLNPRSSDTNILGMEPTWQVQPTEYRASRLSKAFSWYNYFYGKKDARDMIVNYLEAHDRRADVRLLKGIPDSANSTDHRLAMPHEHGWIGIA
jgi:hypothetical protein